MNILYSFASYSNISLAMLFSTVVVFMARCSMKRNIHRESKIKPKLFR